MVTPIDPQACLRTGRILTEWFETPEYTDEELKKQALEHHGIEKAPEGFASRMTPAARLDHNRIISFVSGKKNTKWAGSMSKQEVAHRLNEATKMVSPDNAKFLDDETRARTGLELNPLWQMETIVRSGVLSPKDQIAALKELAGFTHSKAPTLNQNNNVNSTPEDWLLELAKDQYQTIAAPKLLQRREKGNGAQAETIRLRGIAEVNALSEHAALKMAEMEADMGDNMEWIEPE